MDRRWLHRRWTEASRDDSSEPVHRLVADGGEDTGSDEGDSADGGGDDGGAGNGGKDDSGTGDGDADNVDTADPDDEMREGDGGNEAVGSPDLDRSNVEMTESGTAEPAEPKWEKPDPDDIPEFEVRADDPMTRPEGRTESPAGHNNARGQESESPTAGMPNTARSPGDSRIKREGTEGYIAALELCARLPEDVRLPEEAADLVPAAVEAELEQDVQAFAAAEFDTRSPHVDVLEFVERDGEIWLRLRLGISSEAFADLDPDAVRSHALQELEGLL